MVLLAIDAICENSDLDDGQEDGLSPSLKAAAELCGELVVQHVPVSLLSNKSFLVKMLNENYGVLVFNSVLERVELTNELVVTLLSKSAIANYIDPKDLEELQVAYAASKGEAS